MKREWGFHPRVGKFKKLWKTFSPPVEALCVAAGGNVHLPLLTALPLSRLDTVVRGNVLKEFRGKFPGVALSPETLPALGFLAIVQQQCRSEAWAWLTWQRILSEAACGEMQQRKVVRKRDMADIVAEASGLCPEEWDLDLAASPHRISLLLQPGHMLTPCAQEVICAAGWNMETVIAWSRMEVIYPFERQKWLTELLDRGWVYKMAMSWMPSFITILFPSQNCF